MTARNPKADPRQWVALYGDLLYQYTLPRVSDPQLAEDLVQDTFLSALKGLDGYKGEASEKTWLFTILKNKIVDHYRRQSSSLVVNIAPDTGDWFNEAEEWADAKKPRTWKEPADPAGQKELRQIINWCKDRLRDLQQRVFVLKYLEDLDSEKICKVLEISPSNYWVLIHRARLQVRDCIEKHWIKNGEA